jgi:2-dehydro-3-deoxy-L-rhamnonate dehydrogenase (NAD+)
MKRRALVTGGAGGIGQAAAARLVADGVDVITIDIGPGADITLDVTDAAAAVKAVEAIGQVDILVNSAGDTFGASLQGTENMCRAVIPGMLDRGWGRVVNVASVAGAPKAALVGFTRSLGQELAAAGVIVNVVAAAVVDEVAELIAWLTSEDCAFSAGAVYDLGAY